MKANAVGVSRETLQEMLSASLPALGLEAVSVQQQQALLDYVELLLKWNKVYNLTAVRDPLDMMRLHVLDSLAIQNVVRKTLTTDPVASFEHQPPCTPRLLDVGAGAGLPGIVLAILNPDWSITLVDAVQKKVAFMTQAIAQLKLKNAAAVHGRIEQLNFPPFDAAISRAFSDLDLFVKLATPHLHDTACLFAMQGKPDERVVAPFQRCTLYRLSVPGVDAQRHLLILDPRKD